MRIAPPARVLAMPSYVVKAAIADPRAKTFVFARMRTGGKSIAKGDTIFVFASEHDGGAGLIARGIVTAVTAHAKPRGVARWTPRVSITVTRYPRWRNAPSAANS
jgi:hypothetical protein